MARACQVLGKVPSWRRAGWEVCISTMLSLRPSLLIVVHFAVDAKHGRAMPRVCLRARRGPLFAAA